MILILGGTTEGRMAIQTLEEAGKPFFYSTKGDGQKVELHYGSRLSGGMNAEEMVQFCHANDIRLLVDAAHPFAGQLHLTVKQASDVLRLPVIRYERIYPERAGDGIIWCRDYAEAIRKVKLSGVSVLLALTGVQTIGKLKPLWQENLCCYFRILDRENSRNIAKQHNFPSDHLCYYQGEQADRELMLHLAPEAILVKESGVSGGFSRKVDAARSLGIPVFVVCRPALPSTFVQVDGPYGLRRMVEKLLPDFYPLHSGLTTGTCATAAAVAAVYSRLGYPHTEVAVRLPNEETITVPVQQAEELQGSASVIKDAGDDPDVTNGTTVRVTVKWTRGTLKKGYRVHICGGEGIGTVTLPGLGLPVGGPAINETPRQMITENVLRVLAKLGAPAGNYTLVISIPDGKQLAERTFNPRLGVVGGLSVIGTSGIVKPFSSEAFVQSIRKSMEVACATGSPYIVINSGAKSERILHARYPELPLQAFVHYGNFIGETLRIATELHIPRLIMGLMLGKAVKLAEGHLDTHSKHTVMNREFLCQVATSAGCSLRTVAAIGRITLARELWAIFSPHELPLFIGRIIGLCHQHCAPLLPDSQLTVLLLTDNGKVYEDPVSGQSG